MKTTLIATKDIKYTCKLLEINDTTFCTPFISSFFGEKKLHFKYQCKLLEHLELVVFGLDRIALKVTYLLKWMPISSYLF